MGFFGLVLDTIKKSDLVVLVIDARMPKITRNEEAIRISKKLNKKVVEVFTKIDYLNREDLDNLKNQNKDSFFVSNIDKRGIEDLKHFIINLSKESKKDKYRVILVGYPNVGKSSLLNSLFPNAKARVRNYAHTTRSIHQINVGKIVFLDSPGIIPKSDEETKLALISSKNIDKIRNPQKAAIELIETLAEKNPKLIEDFYGVKCEKKTAYEIFSEIGLKKKLLLKKGEVDENRTANLIIRDWQKGKIVSDRMI